MRVIGDTITGVDAQALQPDAPSFAQQVLHDAEITNKKIRNKILQSQEKSKQYYDKTAVTEKLQIGSRVLRWEHPTLASKGGYSGPFIVKNADAKKAHLLWEQSRLDGGWISRDRLRLLGQNDRWQDQHGDMWAPPPTREL